MTIFTRKGVFNMRKYMLAIIFVLLLSLNASFVFASSNPDVVIVNPVTGTTVYSENLLVSVKVTAPTSIKVSVTQESKTVNGDVTTVTSSAIGTTDSFTSTTNLSFYTKKVENVKPGDYKITVNTVDADDAVIFTNTSFVEIKAKEDNPVGGETSDPGQTGPAQFLRNLLKIIFN